MRLCRAAVKALLPKDWDRESRDRLPFELILAVNKIDALPRSASYANIENALRRRVRQAGLPTPSQVHLISSVKYVGIPKLATQLIERVRAQHDLLIESVTASRTLHVSDRVQLRCCAASVWSGLIARDRTSPGASVWSHQTWRDRSVL